MMNLTEDGREVLMFFKAKFDVSLERTRSVLSLMLDVRSFSELFPTLHTLSEADPKHPISEKFIELYSCAEFFMDKGWTPKQFADAVDSAYHVSTSHTTGPEG
jgi:hypothetical protein